MNRQGSNFSQSIKLLCSLVLMVMLVSCATNTVKPRVYQAQSIVLLPTQAMHKDLQSYEATIDELLQDKLNKSDFALTILSPEQYERIHALALESSGAIYDPSIGQYLPLNSKDYAYAVEALIAQKMPVDVLIIPRMLLRDGTTKKQSIEFDGVKREIEYTKDTPRNLTLPTTKGLSIQLRGFAKNNNALKPAVGGISLPYRLTLQNNRLAIEVKSQLFTEKEAKQGIAIAWKQMMRQLDYRKP